MLKNISGFFVLLLLPISAYSQQSQGPAASDTALDTETDISSVISTGSGYEAWSGAVQRQVTDFAVPGTVSEQGLKWTRVYDSSTGRWSFAYTWRVYGQPFSSAYAAVFPDGRTTHFGVGCKERLFQSGGIQQGGGAKQLYLQDGSMVYFDWVYDPADPDTQAPTTEYITPLYVLDRYGRQTNLTWENFGQSEFNLHLTQVTDPTGRYIKIYHTYTNANCPTLVVGSDGQWVKYTWAPYNDRLNTGYVGDELTHVDYSDGSSADYTYAWQPYWPAQNRWSRVMMTARDTRADSPMQGVAYDYNSQGVFPGQVQNERYFDGANVGVNVSSLISNATRGALNSIQTETRGDGPARTIKFVKLTNTTGGRPFVTYKTDYNGVQEKYGYNGNYFVNQITDRKGYITNFTLESIIGNPTRKTHPDTTHVDYTYSDSFYPYYVATVTNENGKITTYRRNAHSTNTNTVLNENMITEIDYPSDVNTPAASETFTYDYISSNTIQSLGLVTNHLRKNGAHEFAAYQLDQTSPDYGLLLKLWNPTSATSVTDADPHTTFTYYQPGEAWPGRIKTITDPNGNVTTYEYDTPLTCNAGAGLPCAGRGLVTKITYADGSIKKFGYDQFGNKTSETDENNLTTTYSYDEYNRLRFVTDPLSETTEYQYTPPNGASPLTHTTKSIRKTISPPQACNAGGITTGQTFDNNWRVLTKIQAEGSSVAATTTFGYDANGNVTSVKDPRNNTTTTTYDNRNRKTQETDPLLQLTKWFYDSVGNITSIQRKDGTTETKTYDAMNRVLTDKLPKDGPASAPTSFITTSFAYDLAGTLHMVTDGNLHHTTFSYDASDVKTEMLYDNNDHQDYAYDANHNLTSRRTVSGVYQVFTYNSRNRKTSMGWHNDTDPGSPDISWTTGIDKSTFTYDPAGRLINAQNNFSTVTRTYDNANRLILDEQNLGSGIDKTVVYEHDSASENTRLHVDDGNGYDRDFCYDAMGRLSTIGDHSTSTTWFQYTYDPTSNVTVRSCLLNGVKQDYTTQPYDALNRMKERDLKIGATTFADEIYGYDAMSRTLTVDREDAKRDAFGYNLNGETTSAQYGLVNGVNPNRTVSYTLDFVGNRTNVVDGGVSKAYVPDDINRYTSVGTDNVTSGPDHQIGGYQGNTYNYVGDSYLSSISGPASYSVGYDALGRCVKRTLNGVTTYYVYDGEKPILEYASTGAILGKNIYGRAIDEILMRTDYVVNQSGQTYYYQDDKEGSVTQLTNSSGAIIESYRYDVFGAPTIKDGSGTVISATAYNNRFLFTGREYVSTFGIYEYRARTYHPGLGRFLSEDPKGFDAGDYNLFRYCMNDPEDHTDPMGLMILPQFMGLIAATPCSDGMAGLNHAEAINLARWHAAVSKAEAEQYQQQAAANHSVTVQSFIAASRAGVYAGDNHGPTDSPTTAFRTTSTVTFSAGASYTSSDTGVSHYINGDVVGKADASHLKGTATMNGAVANVSMNGVAHDPDARGVLGRAFAVRYDLKAAINVDTHRIQGTFNRTDFPSFQIFVDGHRVYTHTEAGGKNFGWTHLMTSRTDIINAAF